MSAAKQRILATASELFYRNGYNATGVDEIIRESGVAKATMYAHFRSKRDLCVAYLQHRNESLLNGLTAYLKDVEPGVNRVLGLFDFLGVFYETKEFAGCWAIRTASELPEGNDMIRAEILAEKKQLMAFIEGLLHGLPKKTSLSARQVFLLYEGAVTESFVHGEKWPIEEAKTLCARMLTL